MLKTHNKGRNELVELIPKGNYAIAAKWADGHNTGIYTWDDWRQIFEENELQDDLELKIFPII